MFAAILATALIVLLVPVLYLFARRWMRSRVSRTGGDRSHRDELMSELYKLRARLESTGSRDVEKPVAGKERDSSR